MSTQNDETTCGRCGKNLNKQGSITCSCCDLWIHPKCTGLDTEMAKMLIDYSSKNKEHFWACYNCSKAMHTLRKSLVELQSKVSAIEIRVDEVDKKTEATADSVKSVSEKVDVLSSDIDSLKKGGSSQQTKLDINHELNDQANRRNNLIAHGLNEADALVVDNTERRKYDFELFKEVCSELNIVFQPDKDIKFISRLGEKPKNGTPRPLIIGFRNRDIRDKLHSSSYLLKTSRNLFNVRLVADLTQAQREVETDMENECELRNAELKAKNPDETFLWRVIGPKGAKRLAQQEERPKNKRPRDQGEVQMDVEGEDRSPPAKTRNAPSSSNSPQGHQTGNRPPPRAASGRRGRISFYRR